MKLHSFAAVLALMLLSTFLPAQVTAPAHPERAGDVHFAHFFGPEHENLIVFNDPLPHMQRVLNDPVVRRIMVEGQLGAFFSKASRTPQLEMDPARLWSLIDQNRRWVPREVVLALPRTAIEDMDRFAHVMMLSALTIAANEEDDEESRKHLPQLQAQLIENLKQLHMPGMRIYVRLRDEQDAVAIMQLLQMQLQPLMQQAPVDLQIQGDSIRMTFNTADILSDHEERLEMLDDLGLLAGTDDPAGAAMSEAIAGFSVQTQLQRHGEVLLLTFGQDQAAAPLRVDDLGPLYRQDAATVLFARWNIKPLKQMFENVNNLWSKWEQTAIGERVVEMDDEDLLGDLSLIESQLEHLSDTGTMRMWTEPRSLLFATIERGAPEGDDLHGTPLPSFIPADADAFELDTTASLADRMAALLFEFEDRLETEALKAEFRDDDRQAVLTEAILRAYYQHFGDVRGLIYEQAEQHFSRGVAMVLGTHGRVNHFEVQFTTEGQPVAIRGEDLPTVEIAFIGRTADAEKATQFMHELYGALTSAALSAAGMEPPDEGPPPRALELGLGVPTWGFDSAWITQLSGSGKATIKVDGDLVPHMFLHEDMLVLSTSARLSRALLAAAHETAPRADVPRQPEQKLVIYALFSGNSLVRICDHLAAWIDMLSTNLETEQMRRQQGSIASAAELIRALGDLGKLITQVEAYAVDLDDARRSHGTVRFAEP